MFPRQTLVVSLLNFLFKTGLVFGQSLPFLNYEDPPISYSLSSAENKVVELQDSIDKGEVTLEFDSEFGYLTSLLQKLHVSPNSQVLTFAKTSKQKPHISPKTPRAIYFNDDLYVGYVQDGMIEVAVTDQKLGMVFYTLPQIEQERPKFERDNTCLTCHGAARTNNVPGLQVRSVIPDVKGQPIVSAGSYLTDHSSPLEHRWGGWYVSGTHGDQQHLGNFISLTPKVQLPISNASGVNQTELSHLFPCEAYLSPTSDIVALMVLEHQVKGKNLLTYATFAGQIAEKTDEQVELHAIANELAEYLLFRDETQLTSSIRGTSDFTKEFTSAGQRDSLGRSLRDFDLQSRLFKYPCSYLIETNTFASLPANIRNMTLLRIKEKLNSPGLDLRFPGLTVRSKREISEILTDIIPGFDSL